MESAEHFQSTSFLISAFETIGAVSDELLTDNMKTVMDDTQTKYSKGNVNVRFAQFAKDYGFKIRPCLAGRSQDKSKSRISNSSVIMKLILSLCLLLPFL